MIESAMQVFVQLSYGYGARVWHDLWTRGKVIGVNEKYAYGYYRAAGPNVVIEQSEDLVEPLPSKAVRYAVRLLLGFDFVHAWRNRHGIRKADIVWTHTEAQSLATAMVLLLSRGRKPRLLAQSVWLVDRWPRRNSLQKALYRFLLNKADLLTFHSPDNRTVAARMFPTRRTEVVLFGINADTVRSHPFREVARDVRILSLGNDEHRDWKTLVAAGRRIHGEVRIISRAKAANDAVVGATGASVVTVQNNDELWAQYEWADIVVVPLLPNLHASGCTVVQEATLMGLPVIATDVGGLREYFDETAVRYVQPGDAHELTLAINEIAADPGLRVRMVANAQARMKTVVNSQVYAERHVELSRQLLGR
ncbi:glycosyltransferase family 4 protein [Acetobacter sacchari]|uniref:Glycosyltransferase family 4 protein n=1 Tax=Acetobacter sacchari TaxID=2661687 RepID=A0ABS3LYH0_9PROT|nr:glycosyltransferase family 4 protein [Acetobacter sacchari]MBO1360964.1 glycosyltransferase family 4 protein [Acetobacter sacchari]